MKHLFCIWFLITPVFVAVDSGIAADDDVPVWNQWRGPQRNGIISGSNWPTSLDEDVLTRDWRVELPPSYSGPIVTEKAVFVTGTVNKENEIVLALDRKTGDQLWSAQWPGAMTVPFFAAANGSWIRATPAYDGENLYVAGMRDVLVCFNAQTGEEQWRVDFVDKFASPLPSFGFVSSPLVDEDSVYVQAAASFVKLDKKSGEVKWRVLQEEGGMLDSPFSSPIFATIADQRQVLVQTRAELTGVDPDSGQVLWRQDVPSFRGMNILTPVPYEDGVFTSTYQNKSWLFQLTKNDGQFELSEAWNNNAQGYMSTPVVIDGHAYLHLQNQRFTCIDLKTGERTWTSRPYGKYCSLVAQGKQILALDERGSLLLLKANPAEFELVDERKVSESEAWAHLAVCGDEVFVRELDAISSFTWKKPSGR